MAINNWRATYDQDYMMSQINSLAKWTKTPAQVRAENDLYPLPSGNSPVITQRWPGEVTPRTVVANTAAPYTAGPVITQRWPGETTSSATVTNTQPATFSNADVYRLQSEGYANQGNTAMANAYWDIANNLWAYSNFANTSLNSYDALLNYLKQNEAGLQNVAWKTYNTLVWDIQSQRDYINQMFGPEWSLTREVNRYYDDLWNYLSTDAGKKAAEIAAQWMHSWASLWAIRAQQNQAYNESFWRYVQAKEQQINAKQQIASNLINYMSALRKEYWDTTNQYIIDLYKRANDMYKSVAESAQKDINQYNKLRASSSSSSNNGHLDIWGNYIDNNWNIIYTAAQLKEAQRQEDALNRATLGPSPMSLLTQLWEAPSFTKA